MGAIFGLAIASTVEPGLAQALLTMAAHAIGGLFGENPPLLIPPPPNA